MKALWNLIAEENLIKSIAITITAIVLHDIYFMRNGKKQLFLPKSITHSKQAQSLLKKLGVTPNITALAYQKWHTGPISREELRLLEKLKKEIPSSHNFQELTAIGVLQRKQSSQMEQKPKEVIVKECVKNLLASLAQQPDSVQALENALLAIHFSMANNVQLTDLSNDTETLLPNNNELAKSYLKTLFDESEDLLSLEKALFEKLVNSPNTTATTFQALGYSQHAQKQYEAAHKAYNEGIKMAIATQDHAPISLLQLLVIENYLKSNGTTSESKTIQDLFSDIEQNTEFCGKSPIWMLRKVQFNLHQGKTFDDENEKLLQAIKESITDNNASWPNEFNTAPQKALQKIQEELDTYKPSNVEPAWQDGIKKLYNEDHPHQASAATASLG